VLNALTEQLNANHSLTPEQVQAAVAQLINEDISPELKAEFLTALARKGESAEEIAAFAAELRTKSLHPPLDETTRGNRAITSQSGSADVLEALGIPIHLTPEEAADALREHQFAFLFAPNYHPAFRHIGPARKLCAERNQRTIFNFLGPLLNPAVPTAQLIGVPRPDLCEPLAKVLQSLGTRRGMVVSGCVPASAQGEDAAQDRFLDEFSTLGENTIAEFYQDRGFSVSTVHPSQFPVRPATLADLAGGDRETNAGITRSLLAGKEKGPKRDAVLLNAAAALFVAGQARTLSDGWDLAARLIDEGKAAQKLKELIDV